MVRSSKHTVKFTNAGKLKDYRLLCQALKSSMQVYLQMMLDGELPVKKYVTSPNLPDVNGINFGRWKQHLYTQASQILSQELAKTKTRVFKRYNRLYARCVSTGTHKSFTDKRFSDLRINYLKRIKINLKNFSIPLDSRFFDIQKDLTKEFDEYVRIVTPFWQSRNGKPIRKGITIKIPIKHHKQSNRFRKWTRKETIRISESGISFCYEKPEKTKRVLTPKSVGIGIDLGYKKAISASNGEVYGESLETIYKKIVGRKRKSKGFKRALTHRTNETNRIVNQFLYQNDFDVLMVEDLKAVKHKSRLGRKTNNLMRFWSYRQVLDKLSRRSEEEGFLILKVDPAYTSQTCSACGTLDKNARKGEVFSCGSCDLVLDADINAARNIWHRGVEGLASRYSPSDFKAGSV